VQSGLFAGPNPRTAWLPARQSLGKIGNEKGKGKRGEFFFAAVSAVKKEKSSSSHPTSSRKLSFFSSHFVFAFLYSYFRFPD
jgi:hypothetical protein